MACMDGNTQVDPGYYCDLYYFSCQDSNGFECGICDCDDQCFPYWNIPGNNGIFYYGDIGGWCDSPSNWLLSPCGHAGFSCGQFSGAGGGGAIPNFACEGAYNWFGYDNGGCACKGDDLLSEEGCGDCTAYCQRRTPFVWAAKYGTNILDPWGNPVEVTEPLGDDIAMEICENTVCCTWCEEAFGGQGMCVDAFDEGLVDGYTWESEWCDSVGAQEFTYLWEDTFGDNIPIDFENLVDDVFGMDIADFNGCSITFPPLTCASEVPTDPVEDQTSESYYGTYSCPPDGGYMGNWFDSFPPPEGECLWITPSVSLPSCDSVDDCIPSVTSQVSDDEWLCCGASSGIKGCCFDMYYGDFEPFPPNDAPEPCNTRISIYGTPSVNLGSENYITVYYTGGDDNQDPCDNNSMNCGGGGQITSVRLSLYGPTGSGIIDREITEISVESKCCYYHHHYYSGLTPECTGGNWFIDEEGVGKSTINFNIDDFIPLNWSSIGTWTIKVKGKKGSTTLVTDTETFTVNESDIGFPDTPGELGGDSDVINVQDIVTMVSWILSGSSGEEIYEQYPYADLNNDGIVNVQDMTSLVCIILSDCAGTPCGTAVYDECGTCGGPGRCPCGDGTSSCECCNWIDTDDDDVHDSVDDCNGEYDECGVCNGSGSSECWDGSIVCDLSDCPETIIPGKVMIARGNWQSESDLVRYCWGNNTCALEESDCCIGDPPDNSPFIDDGGYYVHYEDEALLNWLQDNNLSLVGGDNTWLNRDLCCKYFYGIDSFSPGESVNDYCAKEGTSRIFSCETPVSRPSGMKDEKQILINRIKKKLQNQGRVR